MGFAGDAFPDDLGGICSYVILVVLPHSAHCRSSFLNNGESTSSWFIHHYTSNIAMQDNTIAPLSNLCLYIIIIAYIQ